MFHTPALKSSQQKAVEENRLSHTIRTTEFCGRQEIPLRGHRDANAFSLNETDCNDGVFKAALRLRVEAADKQISDLFLKASHNASYLSWKVQNQIIYLIGDATQKQILSDISRCKYFSILADKTTDVSQTEQLSLSVRLSKIPKCTKNICALFQFLQQQAKILHLRFSPNYLNLGLIWNIFVAKVMMAQVI